jgi:ribosomal protein S25
MSVKKNPLYSTWKGMRSRCNSSTHSRYKDYGGRGIKICSEWDDFYKFYFDMGDRPKGKTLDRIDNNGPYCKENCKWSTPSEQNRNARRSVLNEDQVKAIRKEPRHRKGGKPKPGTVTIQQIADKYGVAYGTVRSIIKKECWKEI